MVQYAGAYLSCSMKRVSQAVIRQLRVSRQVSLWAHEFVGGCARAQSMLAVRRQAHISQSSKVKILLAEVRCVFCPASPPLPLIHTLRFSLQLPKERHMRV